MLVFTDLHGGIKLKFNRNCYISAGWLSLAGEASGKMPDTINI